MPQRSPSPDVARQFQSAPADHRNAPAHVPMTTGLDPGAKANSSWTTLPMGMYFLQSPSNRGGSVDSTLQAQD